MSAEPIVKLVPRNVAALRRGADPKRALRIVPGNPVSTRLESGVGNCYPGLECDLRNLERRFFPFLEVDVLADFSEVRVVSVDVRGVDAAERAGTLDKDAAAAYRLVARTMPAAPTTTREAWMLRTLKGTFALIGKRTLTFPVNTSSMGPDRDPPDAWTAIRMLIEDSQVEIELTRAGAASIILKGQRARYLDDNGSLANMFLPGELTQSLCSPWTHDFRDCACFYWASNHPDIVLPPDPPANTADPSWNMRVDWQRRARALGQLPPAATADGPSGEMAYYELSRDWQKLNFILENREQTTPYRQRPGPGAAPFPPSQLETQLRYAAGVELAVMHVYLAAAFSLRDPERVDDRDLRDDIRAAHYEIMRIAVGEMRHVRGVRDVLAARAAAPPFDPPLRVATRVPGLGRTDPPLPLVPGALSQALLDTFIAIEGPNVAVDGLYARILATLELEGNVRSEESIRRIMTEGQDHQEVFRSINEWLRPYQPAQYLRSATLAAPPPADARHHALQDEYRNVLERLHAGYRVTMVAGGSDVNLARNTMTGSLLQACEAVAAAGFLVTFDPINDQRFAPINPPN